MDKTKSLKHHSQRSYVAQQQYSPEVKRRIAAINALVIQVFLDSKDQKTHNILPFIRVLVYRYNLLSVCDEVDIFLETYTIAIQSVQKGRKYKNLPFWFKGISYNLVRRLSEELRKKNILEKSLESEIEAKTCCNIPPIYEEERPSKKVLMLLDSLKSLSDDEYRLLNLRIVKGMTWASIAQHLVLIGVEQKADSKCINRIRQQGKRALDKLRKNYKSGI